MVGPEELRRLALALPGTTVEDHHGMDSYRVAGKIFATVPDRGHVRVMAGESEIRAAVADDSTSFEPFWWGRRLACVVVDLGRGVPTSSPPCWPKRGCGRRRSAWSGNSVPRAAAGADTRHPIGSAPSVGPA